VFGEAKSTVFIVDSDAAVRDSLRMLLECHGIVACLYATAAVFMSEAHPEANSCIVVDIDLDGLDRLHMFSELHQRGVVIPAIITTSGKGTECFRSAVEIDGATLLEKPYAPDIDFPPETNPRRRLKFNAQAKWRFGCRSPRFRTRSGGLGGSLICDLKPLLPPDRRSAHQVGDRRVIKRHAFANGFTGFAGVACRQRDLVGQVRTSCGRPFCP
jgi:CheY-like chemotaxis protein